MTAAPLILAFDTAGPHCMAALCRGDLLLGARSEMLARGQAERLMPMLGELLAGAGATWADLSAIGVGVGPGNFTGIRIAVSAARGLALGLDIPAVGVTGCEARQMMGARPAAIPAPRDHAYLCDPEAPDALPRLVPLEELPQGIALDASPPGLAEGIARIALQRWQDTETLPAPLYLRPADAAPARDLPPPILDA